MATRQTPLRRTDVIRCENCGEDYSVTYKRCPFCDERPGKSYPAVGGRRVAGGRSGGSNPLQIVQWVISLIVIIAAAMIVFKLVSPLFRGNKNPGGASSNPGTSQSQGSGSAGQPGAQDPGGSSSVDEPSPAPAVTVTALSLNKTDIILTANEKTQLIATVAPADAAVTWSSSDSAILQVDQDGNLTNVNSTGSKVKVTVTVSAGDKTAECTVYCNGSGAGGTTPSGAGTATTPGTTTTTPAAPGSVGTIVNAEKGLNIRSGPGTTYSVQASTANGATVTILEDAGSGWYKIRYNTSAGTQEEGYVSKSYVSVK